MDKDSRPVVLLCFGYHRQGWIRIFENLNNDFDFHYLYYVYPAMETVSYTEQPKHYWSDYKNSRQILDTVKPVKIIFMETGSLLILSMLFECRRRSIPTFVMQHGLFHDVRTNLAIDKALAGNRFEAGKKLLDPFNVRNFIFSFFARSFRLADAMTLLPILKWQLNRRKMFDLEASVRNRGRYQRADYYIVYTKFNGRYFTETDGATEKQMLEIGVPEFDLFFKGSPVIEEGEAYDLLIDSAWSYSAELESTGIIDLEKYNSLLSRINAASLESGRRLYIKLHPYSYSNEFLVQHTNIIYFRDTDIIPLLTNARSVIGFDSTLMLCALYLKPTVIITMDKEAYFAKNISTHIGRQTFFPDEISVSLLHAQKAISLNPDQRRKLVELFLFRVDGNSAGRLKAILQTDLKGLPHV